MTVLAPTGPSAPAATSRPATSRPAATSSPGARAAQHPGPPLRIVATLTWTNLLGFVREPVGFTMQFLYPLFMLLIFSAVFPGDFFEGITYAQYLLPAMVTTGVLTNCLQDLAITVAAERETGSLKRLAVMPAPPWAHVVSKCITNVILALLNATLLITVANKVLGVELPTSAGSWGLLALTMVLMVATCTGLGLAVGRTRPSSRAASGLVTPIVLIFQFVSGIFFPLAQLPTWMVSVASIFPVRWSAELMRESLLPAHCASLEPTGTWETGKGLTVVAAWLVAGVVAAVIITRRDTVDR